MKNTSPNFLKNKDKTFVINLTLTPSETNSAYDTVIKSIQTNFESKGFRKGKAPIEYVKANVSQEKVIEEILSTLISEKYNSLLKSEDLHPIVQPQVKVLNPPLIFDKEWEIEITGCELPEITLDQKYIEEVKTINSSKDEAKIKLDKTIGVLLKHAKANIPELLIKADLENKLAQLVDQTRQAGLTVSQYLKSRNQTVEQYQQELAKQINQEWITNLAIDHIAKNQKITVTDKEVDEIVSKNSQLSQNLNLVYYLLTQQKVFDYLKTL